MHNKQHNYRWKYVPRTDSTSLRIVALENSRLLICSNLTSEWFKEDFPQSGVIPKMPQDWPEPEDDPRMITYWASSCINDGNSVGIIVSTDASDRETLLQTAITQVIVDRITRRLLPFQLEEYAKRWRSTLPHWQKWIEGFNCRIDRERYPYID